MAERSNGCNVDLRVRFACDLSPRIARPAMTFVLLLAILNLGLGFGLAVGYARWFDVGPAPAEAQFDSPATFAADAPLEEVLAAANEIPAEWRQVLGESEECRSLVEASVHVLRLEVGKYRQHLIDLDGQVRSQATQPSVEVLAGCLTHLQALNADWLARQADAGSHLQSRRGQLGAHGDMASQLEDILLEQAAQIETCASNLNCLDVSGDPEHAGLRMITEIRKLLDMAHALRDRMQECFASIICREGRFETLDTAQRQDPLLQIASRPGFDVVLETWWRDDPHRNRQAALVLIDLDRFSRLIENFGTPAGDQILAHVGRLLSETIDRPGETSLAGRVAGQRLGVLVCDNGPQFATSIAERFRQRLAATSFDLAGKELEITASVGVTELEADDSVGRLLDRASRALRKAKAAGRNRTFLDAGQGPAPVEPPQYDVPAQVLTVDV